VDRVDVAVDVTNAPRRHADVPLLRDLEAESDESHALLVGRDGDAHDLLGTLGAEPDYRRLLEVGFDVRVAGPPSAGQIDEELGRVDSRLFGKLRRHTLLPTCLRLGAHAQPFAAQ